MPTYTFTATVTKVRTGAEHSATGTVTADTHAAALQKLDAKFREEGVLATELILHARR